MAQHDEDGDMVPNHICPESYKALSETIAKLIVDEHDLSCVATGLFHNFLEACAARGMTRIEVEEYMAGALDVDYVEILEAVADVDGDVALKIVEPEGNA